MKTLEQMKRDVEERKLSAIFGDFNRQACDCATCPYEKECEFDNPNFDANSCKVN